MADTQLNQRGKCIIEATNVQKTFTVGANEVLVLKSVDLKVKSGDFLIFFGPSGCGKSTLLHCLMGLEYPTSGTIQFDGQDLYTMSDDERALYRRHKVGIIHQQPIWISSLNVLENILFPLHLLNYSKEEMEKKGKEMLALVGMEEWATYRPTELSSGQQQKISLARSLVIEPEFIFADEPTGNLDTSSGRELLQILEKLNSEGLTILMVTHDLEYLSYANAICHMVDGQIIEQYSANEGKRLESKTNHLGKRGDTSNSVRDPDFLKKLVGNVTVPSVLPKSVEKPTAADADLKMSTDPVPMQTTGAPKIAGDAQSKQAEKEVKMSADPVPKPTKKAGLEEKAEKPSI